MTDRTRLFTLDDQHAFARMSGDVNPMHLDALYARRTQAAEPAVHGIHGLLWALDRARITRAEFGAGARVRFESFLYLDQPVALQDTKRGDSVGLELVSRGRMATSIILDVAVAAPAVDEQEPIRLPDVPNEVELEGVLGRAGAFVLHGDDADFLHRFAQLSDALGVRRVRAIAGLSTLVGMVVPGLHSIFSRCEIALVDDHADGETLSYTVIRTNPVLRTAVIAFRGAGISGRIDAFVRTPPVVQASIADLSTANGRQDFTGRRALVIGGSRGLGELTAKLLALRGADVTVTYLRGQADAERVASELRQAGHGAAVHRFDTAAPDLDLLRDGGFDDVFYYATPAIFARRMAGYDAQAMDGFVAVYCHQFAGLCEALAGNGRPTALFWPSSTALDDYVAGLMEYSAAKAAGEMLCASLPHRHTGLQILVRRLPRLDTDQTASVIPVMSGNTRLVVDGILDAMVGMRG